MSSKHNNKRNTQDLPRGLAEPPRLAYVLIVEGATKAWSLFQLPPLLKRTTKIDLEGFH
jgi:hypothetical protein